MTHPRSLRRCSTRATKPVLIISMQLLRRLVVYSGLCIMNERLIILMVLGGSSRIVHYPAVPESLLQSQVQTRGRGGDLSD